MILRWYSSLFLTQILNFIRYPWSRRFEWGVSHTFELKLVENHLKSKLRNQNCWRWPKLCAAFTFCLCFLLTFYLYSSHRMTHFIFFWWKKGWNICERSTYLGSIMWWITGLHSLCVSPARVKVSQAAFFTRVIHSVDPYFSLNFSKVHEQYKFFSVIQL